MFDPDNVPPVTENEETSRFVFFRDHIRKDLTVRPDAFIPHPYPDLSVMRKQSATEEEIWASGRAIGSARNKPLRGRVDRFVHHFKRPGLIVNPDPVADNPNHAVVVNWNPDKAMQRMAATEIAADARCLLAESI